MFFSKEGWFSWFCCCPVCPLWVAALWTPWAPWPFRSGKYRWTILETLGYCRKNGSVKMKPNENLSLPVRWIEYSKWNHHRDMLAVFCHWVTIQTYTAAAAVPRWKAAFGPERQQVAASWLFRHKNQRAIEGWWGLQPRKSWVFPSFWRNLGCQTNGTKTCLRCDT